jgi:hypothetical protein
MAVENFGNIINMGKESFMVQPKKGIDPNLVERTRFTMRSRNEGIDDQVPRQRFSRAAKVGRAARLAAQEVEQEYIRTLFRSTPGVSELPETTQD